ncbi:MAG: MFS transporter [Deltaproteobacteria bacterium]|nr:MFS transporter [Deltaproteobacteria bacterium]
MNPPLLDAPAPSSAATAAFRRGLAVLTLVNLFNYLDRFVISSLFESLREAFAITDRELGMLGPGFIIVYMLASPVFGALGDRGSRTRLIALGVGVWSLATVLGGFAGSFFALLACRALVGVGEAAYGTISPSLLSDYFPRPQRGRVFAIFYAAIPIGSALGFIVGGLLDEHFGWRSAFFVAGAPGLLLALACLRLADPPRGAMDEPDPNRDGSRPARGIVATYAGLLRNGAYTLTVLGYAAYTFAIGGLAMWMPAFLERVRGVPREDASIQFGAIVVVTGFVGTFAGGWLGDWFLKRNRQAYLWLSGIATLLAVPFAFVALRAESPTLYLPAIVVAEILLFASTGPINSAIVNLVSPAERATAVAFHIFAIHILGDVPSPYLIGLLSAEGGSSAGSLSQAMLIVPVAVALGGLIWMAAAWHAGRRETARA